MDALRQERDRSTLMFEELQHRVANNLSFVASLIGLEQRRLRDGADAAEILTRVQDRLDLMSRIHRRLHDPRAAERPVADQLRALCDDLLAVAGATGIVCDVTAPGVTLGLTRLLPVALIVAETVTNAAKHAFPAGRGGSRSRSTAYRAAAC
ncbi:histidine kinase dimerization/phosphoacceptor domain -containing protein [Methylobacterium sp. ID0610]|uniref:histidine kinase dimerization/phosphoacceptor domain -containing protein n=1 Tax=Methylobacterium carpenticola TaxID=3344827 RepID=UPI0036CF71B5